MKYIVFKRKIGNNGLEQCLPIVFPHELVHADVAKVVKSLRGMEAATPISAGDVTFRLGAHCNGSSITLNLESRGHDDSVLIDGYDYFHGFI